MLSWSQAIWVCGIQAVLFNISSTHLSLCCCCSLNHVWLCNPMTCSTPGFPILRYLPVQFSSVQFSHSVVFYSLRPHESQHASPPCPLPTPRVPSDSSPSSQWCHPAISSSVVPFSSCPQSLPGSESFPMSQLFSWGGQSTGVSALASFLPKKSQGWSSEWTGWISSLMVFLRDAG